MKPESVNYDRLILLNQIQTLRTLIEKEKEKVKRLKK